MQSNQPIPPDSTLDYGVPLTRVLALLRERWGKFFALIAIGLIITAVVILWVPRYFVASVLVLPPQQQQSAAATALSQLGALAGMAGSVAGVKSQDEMYAALLKTRKVRDRLISAHQLGKHYGKQTPESVRSELASRVEIDIDKKTGLLSVTVADLDAKMSATLANAHVEVLREALAGLAVTEAQQRRVFFEQQVAKAKNELSQAEVRFKVAQAQGGMVASSALAEAGVRDSVQLRAQITAHEVALQSMRQIATAQNPEFKRVAGSLESLRAQLAIKENGSGKSANVHAGLEATQAYRDVKVQEVLLELLLKQYEMSKVDEAKDGPLLQVVDPALVPERAEKPKRSLIAFSGLLITLVLAVGLTLAWGTHPRKVA